MKSFKIDCVTMLKLICQKIINKALIKYKLCKEISKIFTENGANNSLDHNARAPA